MAELFSYFHVSELQHSSARWVNTYITTLFYLYISPIFTYITVVQPCFSDLLGSVGSQVRLGGGCWCLAGRSSGSAEEEAGDSNGLGWPNYQAPKYADMNVHESGYNFVKECL